jgi:hypothetical protein
VDDLKAILERASGPGDLATVLLAGTAGFFVDAGLNVVGFLEPGLVGITAASGALGVKKAVEARLLAVQAKQGERKRAARLLERLRRDANGVLADRLQREIELFDDGITGVEELRSRVDETLNEYRAAGPRVEPPARRLDPETPSRVYDFEDEVT